jgi:ubiquitin carboxyl-terminal hydrolase 4/11/15
VFTLKRFQSRSLLQSKKIDCFVSFPLEGLDLSDSVIGKSEDGEELLYDLFAVSNHIGGIGGGHCK